MYFNKNTAPDVEDGNVIDNATCPVSFALYIFIELDDV